MKKLSAKNSLVFERAVEKLVAGKSRNFVKRLRQERDREIAKLGKRGPERVAALAEWMVGVFGQTGLAWITSAARVRFFERLRPKKVVGRKILGMRNFEGRS